MDADERLWILRKATELTPEVREALARVDDKEKRGKYERRKNDRKTNNKGF